MRISEGFFVRKFKKFSNNLLSHLVCQKVERLMCEVEFWEVFLRNVQRFFIVFLIITC